jgi:hypothetical protein
MSRRWTRLLLVPLLAAGCFGECKRRPAREFSCKTIAYYEALNPEQDAGEAPFSIERLGPKLEEGQVQRRPLWLRFYNETRIFVTWQLSGHDFQEAKATYSPEEGLARSFRNSDIVYPMKRFSDGKLEHVHFGFRSKVCPKPNDQGTYYYKCQLTENELFIVADMTCQWDIRFNAGRYKTKRPPKPLYDDE